MSVSTPTAAAARWSALRLRQTTHLRDLCAETSFTTAHLPQFEQQEALTRFEGTFEGNRLELVMQTDQAVRRFTATRQAR